VQKILNRLILIATVVGLLGPAALSAGTEDALLLLLKLDTADDTAVAELRETLELGDLIVGLLLPRSGATASRTERLHHLRQRRIRFGRISHHPPPGSATAPRPGPRPVTTGTTRDRRLLLSPGATATLGSGLTPRSDGGTAVRPLAGRPTRPGPRASGLIARRQTARPLGARSGRGHPDARRRCVWFTQQRAVLHGSGGVMWVGIPGGSGCGLSANAGGAHTLPMHATAAPSTANLRLMLSLL
jgi:hypothetical protein